MIRAVFFESESKLGFEISGHAGGKSGTDIVCASVSSAAYMAANTITDILYISAEIQMDDGFLSFRITDNDVSAKAIIDGLKLHLTELSKQYPKKIKVITEV